MSYTTVLKVGKNKKPEELRVLQNSHGSAPVIWDEMCKKYLGSVDFGYMSELDNLWPKYKDKTIPEYQRAVLMMTYDRAFVSKENYEKAARDIDLFLEDFPPVKGSVNHWLEIANIYKSNPDCEAIGLWCTSVSDNPFDGDWDEDKEEYNLIDWDGALNIYSELDSMRAG